MNKPNPDEIKTKLSALHAAIGRIEASINFMAAELYEAPCDDPGTRDILIDAGKEATAIIFDVLDGFPKQLDIDMTGIIDEEAYKAFRRTNRPYM